MIVHSKLTQKYEILLGQCNTVHENVLFDLFEQLLLFEMALDIEYDFDEYLLRKNA